MPTSLRRWTADAPSNIALVKYMGKTENDPTVKNRPTNNSLSYTLPHLRSVVQLEHDPSMTSTTWEPLTQFGEKQYAPLALSEKGIARFAAHLELMKNHFGFKGHFKIRSANGFPSDCGLASSASSFAALTKVAMIALSELTGKATPTVAEAADWSRKGSGSSCRSFFEPWSLWTPEHVGDIPQLNRYGDLIHQVIVVNETVKTVSSSEAHKRVTSSLLFAGRPNRADMRAMDFINALEKNQWEEAYQIAWAEFWDMHALFETSQPAFGYMTDGSLEVLRFVRDLWTREGHGPLVTMDAGPNVHLLYQNDERGRRHANAVVKHVHPKFKVYSSEKT